ncbi:MAG: hypothetical protein NE330_20310, partial [Lentisphaeraceae bacterium]|nr:hypothetical protein [Lentisphaeraceae bacterium]
GSSLVYFAYAMVAFGLFFLYFYLKSVFKYKKFGQSHLQLKTLPGRLGQDFQGEVHAPHFLKPEGNLHLTIDCKRHYYVGSRDSRKSKTDLLFKDDFSIDPKEASSQHDAFIIPVTFSIPADKPESDESIFWTLHIYASTPGLDWSETYKIPIYK